ncbi:hypothetical protein GQS52_11320 [Streptomyces sp. SCUT-3]|uniref:hypothetical protein n=1 Tax=Streptomyces sp. SCUT-3 TaxID=2684469 RepID=UPI000CB1F85B|nr:hypothetical protein [Streptomyces sp. SCUT-3]PLW73237.1 hypothetical protein C0036_08270 [Streptomyces sp. DJ]QMV22283.1 hypothetical protein GQS52_11320 [Streptomyces sp. SCUT-3]
MLTKIGFWCENIALTAGEDPFLLDTYLGPTPSSAVRWMWERARRSAPQLAPAPAEEVACWLAADGEHRRAVQVLEYGSVYLYGVLDDEVHYLFSARPVHVTTAHLDALMTGVQPLRFT